MRTFKNYKKDFLTGEVRDLILFVNELKSLPKDKDGWSNLSSIVTNILSTPISSIFCNGKFRVSEVTSIIDKNDNIKEYIVRFEIIYNDGVSYRKFDKLTDELYLRFELKLKLSEIGLLENLEK